MSMRCDACGRRARTNAEGLCPPCFLDEQTLLEIARDEGELDDEDDADESYLSNGVYRL